MPDPNLAVADPDPVAAAPGQTAKPEPLALAALYPACFDRENPRPLKIGIHLDLRARHPDVPHRALRKALAVYCGRARYLKSLKAGLLRWDLHGRPAGLVTLEQGTIARQQLGAGKPAATGKPDLPPDTAPVPEENLAPGRLELAAKFSVLPGSRPVAGGVEVSVPTDAGTVTAILPAKVWRKLEQAAKGYPQWVAALSGSLERFADGEIALRHPALQIFERKAQPEVEPARAVEAATPAPAATPEPPEAKATEAKAPASPASNPSIVRAAVSRKGQGKP